MAREPRFRARPATSGLITACTIVFVGCVVALLLRSEQPLKDLPDTLWAFPDPELLVTLGGLAAPRVWLDHEWWRVASAGLLHGSWLHLGLNMLALWSVGQWTEKAWGWWRQLVVFAVSSVGGCLASLAWAEAPLVVGASAGIFGLAGALVVARAWGREAVQRAMEPVSARGLGFWLVFWLVVGALLPLAGVSLLAQAGHVGGLVFGCVLGWVFSRPSEQRFWGYLGAGGVVLGLGGVWAASVEPSWRANYHVFVGAEYLERGRFEEAAASFEVALGESPGGDPQLANAGAYSLAEAGVRLERAEELVGVALEADPGNPDYMDTMGWIRCKQGRVEAGVVWVRLALALAEREVPEIEAHVDGCSTWNISE